MSKIELHPKASHLAEIAIEPRSRSLRVIYWEADQGGTQLLYIFRIPPEDAAQPTLESRYAHDPAAQPTPLAWPDLPDLLLRDTRSWLSSRIDQARAANKPALEAALVAIDAALTRAAA